MAKFPIREAEIKAPAQNIVTGLTDNAALYPAGPWTLISMAIETETTLNNPDRVKDWECRVIVVNKASEGMPSNTVAAVV